MKFAIQILTVAGMLMLLSASGCGKEDHYQGVPDVPVSFVIDPNSTQYLEISHVSGWIYLTGGYNGILVYRPGLNEFVAYDRACPYDYENPDARIEVEASGTTCVCPVCGSKYIMLDGSPYEGPSRYLLKPYQATYDGNLLYIYN